MSPPRKPRSPGQRQFGGHPMGSPADWHKVVHSPEVQRMLNDPQLAQALYHNFRATGGQLPEGMLGTPPAGAPPVGMQDGGGVPTPEDLNRLAQIRGGDVDPETDNSLQMLAQQSRPARPVRPMRFDDGGGVSTESIADINKEEQEAQTELKRAQDAGNPRAVSDAWAKIGQIAQKRAKASASQTAAPSLPGTVASAPTALGGNLGQVSGSTMAGLKALQGQGPPTPGNMAMNIGLGALFGGAGTGSGAGALIGAATAGMLNYFIRKNAQKPKPPMSEQPGNTSGATDVNGQPGTQSPGAGGTTGAAGAPPQTETPAPLKPGEGLAYGTANVTGGRVISRDGGKTWTNPNAAPWESATVDPTKVAPYPSEVIGPDQPQSSSDLMSLPTQTTSLQGLAAQAPPIAQGALDATALGDDAMDTGLAKGGPVPHGLMSAHHMPIPVLHTTIVIAAKPKKGKADKKAMGGEIPQAQRMARKPLAIPPIAGPNASGARLPHGRVQVPRGSGSAIKGKRFGGIY